MTRPRKNIWPTLLLCAALLGVGGVAGFFLRPIIVPVVDLTEAVDEPADPGHGGSEIVELTETTLENMSLQFGKFDVRDYYQNIRIPAKVVERIPQSRRSVTAPIAGRVENVLIAQGQAVRPGEKLFEFQITDESLSQSQVGLLGVISDIAVNQNTLRRKRPLAEKDVIRRTIITELELEIDQLEQRRDALKQELTIRGMNEAQIEDLIDNKRLMQTITIYAPELTGNSSVPLVVKSADVLTAQPVSATQPAPTNKIAYKDEAYYTVESITALEGSNQSLGEALCELTYHSNLLIEGMAYESDIEQISKANDLGWKFTAQFGEGKSAIVRKDLKLFKIENHVDNLSQTYPIFVEIENEIVSRTTDDKDRLYVNWRFKPGQRANLEFPIAVWEKQVVVPLAALAKEGPEAFVFLKISHTHTAADGTVIHEFQKVPVKVLHTDKNFAVLEKNIKLDVYEEYALDQAYKLNLALKQAAGGGGHGHDH